MVVLRRELVVLYTPFGSALQFLTVFLIVRRMHFSRLAAIGVSIFAATTFCQPDLRKHPGDNGILHSVWGDEWFLYASHWLIPLIVLMGQFVKLDPRTEGICAAAFAALCVAVGVVNAQNLAAMFSILRLQGPPQ